MPGSIPIVFKGAGDWSIQFQKDLEKEISGLNFQSRNPKSIRPDEDVVIVCPSYSRVEADLDLAFQGIEGINNARRRVIVLYIHNVSEHVLSGLHTQQTVDCDLQDKYGRVKVIDVGVSSNRLYRCKQNADSLRMVKAAIKRKDLHGSRSTHLFAFSFLSAIFLCLLLYTNPPDPGQTESSEGIIQYLWKKTPFSKSSSESLPPEHTAPLTGSTDLSEQSRPLLSRPWRDIKWDEINIPDLKKVLLKIEVPVSIPTATVLVLGQKGAETKSFLHFIQDTFDSHLDDSKPQYWVARNNLNKFQVVGAEGVPSNQFISLVQGPTSTTQKQPPEANSDWTGINTVSCVVLVASARHIWDELDNDTEIFLDEIRKLNIPKILMITEADSVCEEVRKNIRNMYLSKWLEEIVQRGAKLYHVPVSHVHSVKSYSVKEPQSVERNFLLLRVIQMAFQFSCDHLDK